MRLKIKNFIKCSRGAILVEAAIVLPIFLLLLGATAEFGRFFYTYNTLSKATRASARFISKRQLEDGNNLQLARNIAVYGNTSASGNTIMQGLTTGNIVITPTTGTPETITVSVQNFVYQPIFAIGVGEIPISPSTTIKYLFTTGTV